MKYVFLFRHSTHYHFLAHSFTAVCILILTFDATLQHTSVVKETQANTKQSNSSPPYINQVNIGLPPKLERLTVVLTGDLVYCQQVAHKIGSLITHQSPSGLYTAGRGKRGIFPASEWQELSFGMLLSLKQWRNYTFVAVILLRHKTIRKHFYVQISFMSEKSIA